MNLQTPSPTLALLTHPLATWPGHLPLPEATPLKSENRCPQVSQSVEWNYSSLPSSTSPGNREAPQLSQMETALSVARRRRWALGLTRPEAEHGEKQSRSLPAPPRNTTSSLPPPHPQQQVGAVSPRPHCSGVNAPAVPAQGSYRSGAPEVEGRGIRSPQPPSQPRSSVSNRGSSSRGEQRSGPLPPKSPASLENVWERCGRGAGGSGVSADPFKDTTWALELHQSGFKNTWLCDLGPVANLWSSISSSLKWDAYHLRGLL